MGHGPIRQEYAYDLDKNLTGLTVRSGDALLSQTGYAYDGNGNRIRKQALDGTTLYQYDALNQFQWVDYPAYSEKLFYDKAGNRARRWPGHCQETTGSLREHNTAERLKITSLYEGDYDGNRREISENLKSKRTSIMARAFSKINI